MKLDTSARIATVAETQLDLTRSELIVLEALLRNQGRVISKERLAECPYDLFRTMRNYVHPWRHARERAWSEVEERDFLDVYAIYRTLMLVTLKPSRKRQKLSPIAHEFAK